MSAAHYAGDVAIIGISGAFPGARTTEELWNALCGGREMIRFLEQTGNGSESAEEPGAPRFIPAVAVMDDIELFDADFFGMTHAESELTDPQHRVLLEHCWSALEHAGYNSHRYGGVIGVFAGATINTYLVRNLLANRALLQTIDPMQVNIGNGADFLTTRISYKLNLTGPSHTVQSACSTSLVAVHCACRTLLDLECDMALAGGVSINVNFLRGYRYQDGGILSSDGHCRVFDAEARGTVFGSGVGVLVLKRLEDAIADGDHIHAVIKGSAINNDGTTKAGFTAPSVEGQAAVIAEAQGNAGVDADTISYVECHGTGTLLGDPVEIRALTKAFQGSTQRRGFCAVGSVKSNLGHLDAAAGVTGLIKVVLSLEHGQLPASLHYQNPNPQIDFANSPFYVNTELREWKRSGEGVPRRAGVSAFGVGGTNAHVVLEEAPGKEKVVRGREWQLLPVSARSESALRNAVGNLGEYLRKQGGEEVELADISYTLQEGRKGFGRRWVVTGRSKEEVLARVEAGKVEEEMGEAEEGSRKVAFLFPGQGSQRAEMGKELYRREKVFRRVLEECGEILRGEIGVDLCAELYGGKGEGGEIEQTWLAQPALLAVEYGLVQQWKEYGVRPEGMLGHSLGEYTAACVAGVMTLEEGLRVVGVRGKLMQRMEPGAMLAVGLGAEEMGGWLVGGASLAAINGPGLCAVSGTKEEIGEMEEKLKRRGVNCERLRTSHAYHGRQVEPMMEEFRREMEKVKLKEPEIPFISNVSGRWIEGEEARDAGYWVRHLRAPVQFERGVKVLVESEEWMLVEAGPGQTLRRLAQKQGAGRRAVASLAGGRTGSEMESLLGAVGELWKAGVGIKWRGLHGGEKRYRLPLPTYPFERKPYWIDKRDREKTEKTKKNMKKIAAVSEWFWYPSWKLSVPATGASHPETCGKWLIFADTHGIGHELTAQFTAAGDEVVEVFRGEQFDENVSAYEINPERPSDYNAIAAALQDRGWSGYNVIHLWGLDVDGNSEHEANFFEQCQSSGLVSLLHLVQAMANHKATGAKHNLWVVSSRTAQVESRDRIIPEKTGVLALCKILPQEDQALHTQAVDIEAPRTVEDLQDVVSSLMLEFRDPSPDVVIAYRGPYRWVQSYEHISLRKDLPAHIFHEEGAYLITGGLGAVGLLIARSIARAIKAKLVLVGRSPLPPKAEWRNAVKQSPENLEARRVQQILALEELGAEVEVITADVADPQQMKTVWQKAAKRFGRIHGVIHAAGITSGPSVFCLATDAGAPECELQSRPKRLGLQVLKELVRDKDVEFVLSISSNAAVLGGLGFTAYAAANLFMDAFAQRRQAEGSKVRWISADWDHWPEETKKVANIRTSLDDFAMTRDEAEEAIYRLVSLGQMGQIIVATGDLQERMKVWVKPQLDNASGSELTGGNAAKTPRPKMKTIYAEPANETEATIATVWQELLGIEQVGVNDNFFDLGGHSLLVTRMKAELQKALHRDISMVELFTYPTVRSLAECVNKREEPAVISKQRDERAELQREYLRRREEAMTQGAPVR